MRTALHLLSAAIQFALVTPPTLGQSTAPPMAPSQAPSSSNPAAPAPNVPTAPGPALTRAEAERMALANNPRVSVSHLLALAQHQVVHQARSGKLPTLTGSLTAQDANQASRVSSDSLSASRLFTRAAGGVNFSQLITDAPPTSSPRQSCRSAHNRPTKSPAERMLSWSPIRLSTMPCRRRRYCKLQNKR
jgi:outer membrane protein